MPAYTGAWWTACSKVLLHVNKLSLYKIILSYKNEYCNSLLEAFDYYLIIAHELIT